MPSTKNHTAPNNRYATSSKIHHDVEQLVKEREVIEYLRLFRKDVNHIIRRTGDPSTLWFVEEEVKQKDPIAADYIKELKRKVAYAKPKILKSCRLKLIVEDAEVVT